jgi:hypothetical protein
LSGGTFLTLSALRLSALLGLFVLLPLSILA